ncbi:segregation and condensation protein A [Caldisalinibacter kiritimatiensis]|uniref:Segregation and condensation protein A n=1 Tax=Caldisalinibacter kiritimatiensis TaxID=1304284 RepID=R1CFK4_9FIRM|nr:segregation/condensation protein A [Caldisalinibacter kiritimatiensis]EOD01080.1 Segregation and condensation protein A [Caldisalinibacter kiritimatiensis]
MKYNVVLETFEGPFDLLYHLIEKNEVDIYDIPISQIADQYIEYLETMKDLDLEITSEFLVMAANLLQIKSKMLLPKNNEKQQEEQEEIDPRDELVKRLIEYKKYKNAAKSLKKKENIQSKIFFKPKEELGDIDVKEEQLMLEGIKLIDLMNAFNKIVKKKTQENTEINNIRKIQRDEITIEECMENLKEYICKNNKVRFEELFKEKQTNNNIVVTFLSILELIKLKFITVKQDSNFGEIIIQLKDIETQ